MLTKVLKIDRAVKFTVNHPMEMEIPQNVDCKYHSFVKRDTLHLCSHRSPLPFQHIFAFFSDNIASISDNIYEYTMVLIFFILLAGCLACPVASAFAVTTTTRKMETNRMHKKPQTTVQALFWSRKDPTRNDDPSLIERVAVLEVKETGLSKRIDDGIKEVNKKFDMLFTKIDGLSTKIDDVNKDLSTKIDDVNKDLSTKIDDVNKDLSTKIDDVNKDLSTKINDLSKGQLSEKLDKVLEIIEDGAEKLDKSIDAGKDTLRDTRCHLQEIR
jgi:gas vesicle protein